METAVRVSLWPISSAVSPAFNISWSNLSSVSVQRLAAGLVSIISAFAWNRNDNLFNLAVEIRAAWWR